MTMRQYPDDAVGRAKDGALDWLKGNADGYPRSWAEEARQTERRGYDMYDEFEAPPIAGYEALERDGTAIRTGIVVKSGQERIHFRLADGEQEDGK